MRTKEETAIYNRKYYLANQEDLRYKKMLYGRAHSERGKVYMKEWHKKNKEKVRQYNDENKEIKATKEQVKRTERNKMLFQHKGSACGHCLLSEPDNLEIYDYHHIDPTTKLHNVATIVHGPLDRLMTEVDKCLLLCSNCHRKEHARLRKEKTNE